MTSGKRYYHLCLSSYDAEGYPCIEDHEDLVPRSEVEALEKGRDEAEEALNASEADNARLAQQVERMKAVLKSVLVNVGSDNPTYDYPERTEALKLLEE